MSASNRATNTSARAASRTTISDDRIALANQAGYLAKIIAVDSDLREITINPQTYRLLEDQNEEPVDNSVPVVFPDGFNPALHPIFAVVISQEIKLQKAVYE